MSWETFRGRVGGKDTETCVHPCPGGSLGRAESWGGPYSSLWHTAPKKPANTAAGLPRGAGCPVESVRGAPKGYFKCKYV